MVFFHRLLRLLSRTRVPQIMWWKTYRWPTVCLSSVFPLRLSTSLTSLISTEETHRSSSSPTGTLSISPHQSGAPPSTRISFVLTIRSGWPAIQVSLLGNTLRRRHVRRVPFRHPVLNPRSDRGHLPITQRRVVLEVLDPDVLLYVPGRHCPSHVTEARPIHDPARVTTHLLVVHEGHRCDTAVPVTSLTATLKNRGDIASESHVAQRRLLGPE